MDKHRQFRKAQVIKINLAKDSVSDTFRLIEVRFCHTKDQNLGPLFIDLWQDLIHYTLLLHLHRKRSVEGDLGNAWRQELLTTLLPNVQTVKLLRFKLSKNEETGLVIVQPLDLIRPYLNWGDNLQIAALFAKQLGRILKREAVLVFSAEMMFLCKPAVLEALVKLCASLPKLPPELLAIDGTYLHALERLVVHYCEQAGYRWRMLCREEPSQVLDATAELSVWEEMQGSFQQAAALLAAKLRQEGSNLRQEQALHHCADTYFEKCSKQLKDLILESREKLQSAEGQRQSANAQSSTLMLNIAE